MIKRISDIVELSCILTGAESAALVNIESEEMGIVVSYNVPVPEKNILDFAHSILKDKKLSESGAVISALSGDLFDGKLISALAVRLGNSNKEKLLLLFFKHDCNSDLIIQSGKIENLFSSILRFEEESEYFLNPLSKLETAILITDKKGSGFIANNSFYDLLNIKDQNLNELDWNNFGFYDESDRTVSFDEYPFISAIKKNSNVTDSKLKIIFKDGSLKWMRINSFIMNDDNGSAELVLSMFEDITSIANAESRLIETAENIGSILYSTDAELKKYFFISGAVQKIIGYSRKEIISGSYKIIRSILPEYFSQFKSLVINLRNGKEAVAEYKIKDKSGKIKFLRHSGVPIIENGNVVRIVGMLTDITHEKEIHDKLEKSEEQFRLLVETAEDFIFSLDSHGYFTMVNKNGALSLGYRQDEMIGKHFLEFISENSKAEIAVSFQKILTTEEVIWLEPEFNDKLGKSMVFDVQARQIKKDDKISGMLGIGRNITERIKSENKLKELNAKLIEANRLVSIERDRAKHQISTLEELNKLKNDFISNVSHELRTPLASVVGFAETLVFDKDLPKETADEFINIIFTEGKRLAKLINEVLDFSKLEGDRNNLKFSKFDIVIVLREVADSFKKEAESKSVTIDEEIPEAEILIKADKERISKAIANIISNAVKFTNAEGRIKIIVNDFLKEVEIIISDTGIGIPEEDIPHLFEKFRKVRRPETQLPGAGFGLVAVKQIIDLHKGLINIQSEVDKGTTVIIKLLK